MRLGLDSFSVRSQGWNPFQILEYGARLDTGNAFWTLEDPCVVAETLAPYTVTTRLRDGRVWLSEERVTVEWTPMGEGCLDLRRIVAVLQEQAAPNLLLNLEVICGIGQWSLEVFAPDFWHRYPRMLARDLAPFMALAARGEPYRVPRIHLRVGERPSLRRWPPRPATGARTSSRASAPAGRCWAWGSGRPICSTAERSRRAGASRYSWLANQARIRFGSFRTFGLPQVRSNA